MGGQAARGEALVIKLSDVKVRLQYRWRVRQRLMVLHFARLHGPTAAGRRFGVSVRTIRRWRARWREGALQGLVPRDPRRPRRHGHDPANPSAPPTEWQGRAQSSNRQEEFWGHHRFVDFDAAAVALRVWERRYNHERFSLALQGRTPGEKLAALVPAPAAQNRRHR